MRKLSGLTLVLLLVLSAFTGCMADTPAGVSPQVAVPIIDDCPACPTCPTLPVEAPLSQPAPVTVEIAPVFIMPGADPTQLLEGLEGFYLLPIEGENATVLQGSSFFENVFAEGTINTIDEDGNILFKVDAAGALSGGTNSLITITDQIRVGDGATNYTEIAGDGQVTLNGTARVTVCAWIDAGGIKAPGLKPATAIAHGTLETPAWEFGDEGVAGNQETVSFSMNIDERADRTVAPTFFLGWSANGSSPGNVEWHLEYLWTSEDEDTTAGAQETLTATITASVTSDGLVYTTITGVDVPSSTDLCFHGKLKRLSAGAEDTIADTVELHGVCLCWVSDKLGAN